MSRLVVAVDPGVGVDAGELARSWNQDPEARPCGRAGTQAPGSGAGVFLPPELLEWVAIPLAVNLASNAVYDLVRRLVTRLQDGQNGQSGTEELEIIEQQTGSDRLIVVRLRRNLQ